MELSFRWYGTKDPVKLTEIRQSNADFIVTSLHQIPTGALRENCICVLGNGMVIDPIGILEEISILKKMNIIIKNRILIDYYAHIVTPIHKCIDRTNEQRTDNKIGTTCKGIGTNYTVK